MHFMACEPDFDGCLSSALVIGTGSTTGVSEVATGAKLREGHAPQDSSKVLCESPSLYLPNCMTAVWRDLVH